MFWYLSGDWQKDAWTQRQFNFSLFYFPLFIYFCRQPKGGCKRFQRMDFCTSVLGNFQNTTFGDDFLLFHGATSDLQRAVEQISSWPNDNHLQLNPNKCKELLTSIKMSPPFYTPVSLDIDGIESGASQPRQGSMCSHHTGLEMERSLLWYLS